MNYLDIDTYLIENKRRNQSLDQHRINKIRKAVATFDPLITQEPDANDVTIDLLAEESSNALVRNQYLEPESSNVDNCSGQTSDTRTDQGALVIVQKMGIKLHCKRCDHSWIFSGKLTRYFASCPRCHSSIRIKPLPNKAPKHKEPRHNKT